MPNEGQKSTPDGKRRVSNRAAIILLLILIAGLGLRLFRLNYQGVWYDEAFSLTVSNLSFRDMTAKLVADFVHPPLHYYLLHLVFSGFGFGDFQARLVSAVFGALTIAVMFLLGRYLFDTAAGLIGALLMAISQLAVMYSQEARPYAAAQFFTACAIYCFVVALKEGRRLAWGGFTTFAVLMLYSHYGTVLVLACLWLYGIATGRTHRAIPMHWWMSAGAVLVLAMLPWLATGVIGNALHSSKVIPGSQPPWFSVRWSTFIRDVNRFNNGAFDGLLDSTPRWSFVVGGLLFVWPVWLALRSLFSRGTGGPANRPDERGPGLLAVLWLAPHLALVILGRLGLQYDVRYALFCTVPYYLLAARGIAIMRSPFWRCAWLGGIILYSGFALQANYFVPYKEDYRNALGHIANAQQPGDCALFFPFRDLPLQWDIYHAGQKPPDIIGPEPQSSNVDRCGRVWLVKYSRVAGPSDELHSIEQRLITSFIKVEEHHYFWVDTVLYARRPS